MGFVRRARTTIMWPAVVGAPIHDRTYTTYNPYYRSNDGYSDRGGYRYTGTTTAATSAAGCCARSAARRASPNVS